MFKGLHEACGSNPIGLDSRPLADFRVPNGHLRNRTECPEGLRKFWMGHADERMSDLYDKINEDVEFRRIWAGECGFGFELSSVVPNIPKMKEKDEAKKSA